MKTVLIEEVGNGWVVRPFAPEFQGHAANRQETSVYQTIDQVQAALPEILGDGKKPGKPDLMIDGKKIDDAVTEKTWAAYATMPSLHGVTDKPVSY